MVTAVWLFEENSGKLVMTFLPPSSVPFPVSVCSLHMTKALVQIERTQDTCLISHAKHTELMSLSAQNRIRWS